MWVVGDIAAEWFTLQSLLTKLPNWSSEGLLLAGDLIDRAKNSKEVLNFAMNTPNVQAILGNHESMSLSFHGRKWGNKKEDRPLYQPFLWERENGGQATLDSFGGKIPDKYLDWIGSLPLYLEVDNCFISHAPLLLIEGGFKKSVEEACDINNRMFQAFNIIWNRERPKPIEGKIQIHGHNAIFKKYYDMHGKIYGMCIDSSYEKKLTAYNTKTGEIIQQEFV